MRIKQKGTEYHRETGRKSQELIGLKIWKSLDKQGGKEKTGYSKKNQRKKTIYKHIQRNHALGVPW